MAAGFEKYVRWKPFHKTLLLLAVALVVGAVYYFVGMRPKQQQLDGLLAESARLSEEVIEKKAIADHLDEVKKAVAAMNKLLDQALEKLPTDEEIPKLLKTVSDLANETGLDSVMFKPGPATPVPPANFYAAIPLDMEQQGSFYDLGRFFDKIGRLPRIVTIQDITVTTEDYDKDNSPKLKAVFKAVTFKYLPPDQRPPPDNAQKGKRGGR